MGQLHLSPWKIENGTWNLQLARARHLDLSHLFGPQAKVGETGLQTEHNEHMARYLCGESESRPSLLERSPPGPMLHGSWHSPLMSTGLKSLSPAHGATPPPLPSCVHTSVPHTSTPPNGWATETGEIKDPLFPTECAKQWRQIPFLWNPPASEDEIGKENNHTQRRQPHSC